MSNDYQDKKKITVNQEIKKERRQKKTQIKRSISAISAISQLVSDISESLVSAISQLVSAVSESLVSAISQLVSSYIRKSCASWFPIARM